MKKIVLFPLFLLSVLVAAAQSAEGSAEYNKQQRPAVICEFPYPPAMVEEVITDELKQKGLGKGKSSKGYTVYQAVNFSEISNEKIDLYLNVEKKGRKDKDIAVVTVMVSKGYDNFASSASDASLIQNAINYLNGLKPKLDKHNLELQIAAQEEQLKKAEKKMENLSDEATDLEKKKRKIEQDIEDNKKDQEKQKAEVEKQKQILESLKAQQKA